MAVQRRWRADALAGAGDDAAVVNVSAKIHGGGEHNSFAAPASGTSMARVRTWRRAALLFKRMNATKPDRVSPWITGLRWSPVAPGPGGRLPGQARGCGCAVAYKPPQRQPRLPTRRAAARSLTAQLDQRDPIAIDASVERVVGSPVGWTSSSTTPGTSAFRSPPSTPRTADIRDRVRKPPVARTLARAALHLRAHGAGGS